MTRAVVAASADDRGPDELAVAMFAQLRASSAADRRLVQLALQHRLGSGHLDPRQARIVDALRRCEADLGHAPSRRQWDTWHAAQPRPQDWPSAATIRNAFRGSWGRARAAAGGAPSTDVLAQRLVAQGSAYTDQEMLDALRQASVAIADLTFERYVVWARQQTPRGAVGPRIPRSGKPFRRRWGTWGAATAAALGGTPAAGTSPRAWGRRYTTQRMIEAVRRAAAELGAAGAMTYTAYDRWARAANAGQPVGLHAPRAATIARKFGSWAAALTAAGLLDEDGARRRAARVGRTMTEAQLASWLLVARAELGAWPSRPEYSAWRERRVNEGADVPPSEASIRLRLRGWGRARLLARSLT